VCKCRSAAEHKYEKEVNRCLNDTTVEDKEKCKQEARAQLEEDFKKCEPDQPSKCDLKGEAAFEHKMKECLDTGADERNCKAEALFQRVDHERVRMRGESTSRVRGKCERALLRFGGR
jgi:hypothetical protein